MHTAHSSTGSLAQTSSAVHTSTADSSTGSHAQAYGNPTTRTADRSTANTTVSGSHRNGNGSHASGQSSEGAALGYEPDRPPTKAELRGTLGTVNRKVYEQVAHSRNRLSTKLSAANKQIRQLQKAAESHSGEVGVLNDSLQKIMGELLTLSRIADTAAVSARFGADRQQTADKMKVLQDRMGLLRQVVQGEAQKLDKLTQRKIPVVWFGIAQEVRLMGDFDNWTSGFALRAEQLGDGTFTKFEVVLRLVPGTYQVKFVIDGEWRPAPDWPTVQTEHGTNNVLTVE